MSSAPWEPPAPRRYTFGETRALLAPFFRDFEPEDIAYYVVVAVREDGRANFVWPGPSRRMALQALLAAVQAGLEDLPDAPGEDAP